MFLFILFHKTARSSFRLLRDDGFDLFSIGWINMFIFSNEPVEKPKWILIYYLFIASILQCAEQQMAL
jgi:hypothetical protein